MLQVKKYSGELVPFEERSLRHSLSRSGATEREVDFVFEQIKPKLYDGISTRELYELAFELLKGQHNAYAARYSLKKTLRDLGPEGFYFEKWIASLFRSNGYEAMSGQTVKGHSVTHEIDVVAMKDERLLFVECKFRNAVDAKISVTTPMYFMSRILDVTGIDYTFFDKTQHVTGGWLVTNAYFTTDSIKFGEYHKMNLLGWDYPKEKSLKLRVDENGEYPITCLTQLSTQDKATLLKNQCILVKDIINNPDILRFTQANEQKRGRVLTEANALVNSPLKYD